MRYTTQSNTLYQIIKACQPKLTRLNVFNQYQITPLKHSPPLHHATSHYTYYTIPGNQNSTITLLCSLTFTKLDGTLRYLHKTGLYFTTPLLYSRRANLT